jgi:hypothetical protein
MMGMKSVQCMHHANAKHAVAAAQAPPAPSFCNSACVSDTVISTRKKYFLYRGKLANSLDKPPAIPLTEAPPSTTRAGCVIDTDAPQWLPQALTKAAGARPEALAELVT